MRKIPSRFSRTRNLKSRNLGRKNCILRWRCRPSVHLDRRPAFVLKEALCLRSTGRISIPEDSGRRTRARQAYANAYPSSDPFGAKRFERSRAKTPYGYKRAFDKVARELVGFPLTRQQNREMRAQQPKLSPEQIDKNACRHPVVRERSPRDMPKRPASGWVGCNFFLPRKTVAGLSFLARSMAERERAERLDEPYGFRRRYPKLNIILLYRL